MSYQDCEAEIRCIFKPPGNDHIFPTVWRFESMIFGTSQGCDMLVSWRVAWPFTRTRIPQKRQFDNSDWLLIDFQALLPIAQCRNGCCNCLFKSHKLDHTSQLGGWTTNPGIHSPNFLFLDDCLFKDNPTCSRMAVLLLNVCSGRGKHSQFQQLMCNQNCCK